MTTVINNGGEGESTATGLVLGILLAVVIIILFFVYGLPAIRGNNAPAQNESGVNVGVSLPTGDNGDTNPPPQGY